MNPSDDLKLVWLEQRLVELQLRQEGLRLRSHRSESDLSLLMRTQAEIVRVEREIRRLNDEAI